MNQEYYGYLMCHFTSEPIIGEQVYFSISRDGLYWTELNNSKPVLISDIGEKGVRDPFILRSPKNDKYFIISTDLRIDNNLGWDAAQYNGSRAIIIWESEDLVNWKGPRSSTMDIPEAGCVWAPEAVYDDKEENYLVFFASMVKENCDSQAKQRIYSTRTTDFINFTKPEKYIERENHVIDATIIRSNGIYYRFSKDETRKNISMDYSYSLNKDSFTYFYIPSVEDIANVEGPAVFKFNDCEEWCLLVDQYHVNGGYLPLVTSDLKSNSYRILNKDEYSMGNSLKRHGSVINITKQEYNSLIQRWGTENTVDGNLII